MCLGLGVTFGCRGSGHARATRGPIGRLVGGGQDYFCKSWDCVTSNDGPRRWEVRNQDLLNFSFAKPTPKALGDPTFECGESCNYAQVKIRFNQEEMKKEGAWISGLSWGIQTRTVGGTYIYGGIYSHKPGSRANTGTQYRSQPNGINCCNSLPDNLPTYITETNRRPRSRPPC